MWSFEVNSNSLFDNFAAAVETDTPSKGTWNDDYAAMCERYKVVACPFVKSTTISEGKESCKVVNCIVDLSSWRAMLLACCTTGSKVIDVSVHGCRLEAQHLQDLALALKKMGTAQSLRLQYLNWPESNEQGGNALSGTNAAQLQDAFVALFNDATGLEYISLKGNDFTDEFMAPIIPALAQNFRLTGLNLSFNKLSDASFQIFVKAVRYCTNIKIVSFEANAVTGSGLAVLADLLNGTEVSTEDDAAIKANGKVFGDKNKAIKELNKKRKKANQPELKEIPNILECTVKREKTMYIANRTLKRVDISGCTGLQAAAVVAFAESLAATPAGLALPPAANTFQNADTDPKLVVDCGLRGLVQPSGGRSGGIGMGMSGGEAEGMEAATWAAVAQEPQPWVQLV
jgi:hypothetical protein